MGNGVLVVYYDIYAPNQRGIDINYPSWYLWGISIKTRIWDKEKAEDLTNVVGGILA